jgi:hypothetical protein
VLGLPHCTVRPYPVPQFGKGILERIRRLSAESDTYLEVRSAGGGIFRFLSHSMPMSLFALLCGIVSRSGMKICRSARIELSSGRPKTATATDRPPPPGRSEKSGPSRCTRQQNNESQQREACKAILDGFGRAWRLERPEQCGSPKALRGNEGTADGSSVTTCRSTDTAAWCRLAPAIWPMRYLSHTYQTWRSRVPA